MTEPRSAGIAASPQGLSRAAAALVAFALAGIGAAAPAATEISRTGTERAAIVCVSVGTEVVIRIPGQPGTGYAWEPPGATPQALRYVGMTREAGENAPGAFEVQVFRYRVIATGEADLTFEYRRPFGNPMASDSFTVSITAKP